MLPEEPSEAAITRFYDALADRYDQMTDPGKRAGREREFFLSLLAGHPPATALDAGTGTGFHALLLAEMGAKVTAVDLSEAMLAQLNTRAREARLFITTVHANLAHLPGSITGHFDLIVCMGNTLAHLGTGAELLAVLQGFCRVLHPQGLLVMQVINFDRLLSADGPQSFERATSVGTFQRRQERDGDGVRFTIVHRQEDGRELLHQSIALTAVTQELLQDHLIRAGLTVRAAYGSMERVPFDPKTSSDLIVVASPARGT